MYIQFSIVTLITLFASVVTAPVVQAVPRYPGWCSRAIYIMLQIPLKNVFLYRKGIKGARAAGQLQEWLRGLPLLRQAAGHAV